MCAFDEDGKIPIHVAAMKGRVEVLKELVDVRRDAAHTRVEIMGHGETTVLHLCVQYSYSHLNDEELHSQC
ncbi:hypothetical protein LIER_32552 [Lithospermum erythrorhizon]|uniref:Uncharacterized protein n=1 Tax=Lithospermum erythrorhizon TaxID=34254 RepID=A0AAV3RWD7_LITER